MIAPEKPPFRIAYSTSWRVSLRTLKFGPSVRSPPWTLPSGFEPYASAALSVWQPLQRSRNSTAPRWTWSLSLLDTSILLPQPVANAAQATTQQAMKRRGLCMGAHIIRRHAEAPPSRADCRGARPRGLRGRRQEGRRRREDGRHRHGRAQPADRVRSQGVRVHAEDRDRQGGDVN